MNKRNAMTKKGVLIVAVVLFTVIPAIFLASCGTASYLEPEEAAVREDMEMVADEAEIAPEPEPDPSRQMTDRESPRHIIRRGSINLAVEDSREKVDRVRDIVREFNGFIDSTSVYEIREGQYGARMTIRVPEDAFEEVITRLENLGKATDVRTELEDVTDRYIDLRSRLNSQEAQEARLIEILDMAETVEEVLEVEKELQRVRGEIESMSARLDQLEDQITYSTINISLREETIPTGTISPQAFDNLGNKISEAFTGGINFIFNAASFMVIVFSAILPTLVVLIIIAAIIWLIIRRYIKKKNNVLMEQSGSKEK